MSGLIVVLLYAGGFLVIAFLAILFYMRAVASRRRYRCPNCGEEFRVELMQAGHCNFCGTPLSEETHAGS
jgi:hypothetical protein